MTSTRRAALYDLDHLQARVDAEHHRAEAAEARVAVLAAQLAKQNVEVLLTTARGIVPIRRGETAAVTAARAEVDRARADAELIRRMARVQVHNVRQALAQAQRLAEHEREIRKSTEAVLDRVVDRLHDARGRASGKRAEHPRAVLTRTIDDVEQAMLASVDRVLTAPHVMSRHDGRAPSAGETGRFAS